MTCTAPLLRLAAALSLALLAACDGGGGSTGSGGDDLRLSVFGGDAQRGVPGRPLGTPLSVRVTRPDGSGVEGVEVRFAAAPDAGDLQVLAGTTNRQGVAAAVWTLGTGEPPLRVTATVDAAGVSPSSLTFTAGLLGASEVDVAVVQGSGGERPLQLLGYRAGAFVLGTALRWSLPDTVALLLPAGDAEAPDELVAFAPRRAPAMATGIRWTPAPDTVTLRLRDPVRVPLTVWIVSGPRDSQTELAHFHLSRAVPLWERAGIRFDPVEIVDVTAEPASEPFRTIINAHPCQSGIQAVGRREGRINVYYVLGMAGYGGYGCAPRFAMMSSGTGGVPNFLAHELGHVFGLYHESFGRENVMNNDVTPPEIGVGNELTAGQVWLAHYGAESAMVATYGATPAGQGRACRTPLQQMLPTCPPPTLTLP